MTSTPTRCVRTKDKPPVAIQQDGFVSPDRAQLPRHNARDLTAGGPVAEIELDGHIYQLRVTRSQKLILTK